MLRLIAAILGGLIAAFAIVFATDALFHMASPTPMPAGGDAAALAAYVAGLPPGLLLAMVFGWALAAFAAAWIAARFARRGRWPGWVAAGGFLLATIANFAMVTHPTWMVVAAIVLIVAAGWLGARIGARPAGEHRP